MPTSWRSTASRRVSRATPTSACGSTNSRRASSPLSSMTIERCAEQFAGAPLHCPQNLGFPLAGLAHNGFAIVIINGCVHAPDTDAKSRPTHMRGGGGGGGGPAAPSSGGGGGVRRRTDLIAERVVRGACPRAQDVCSHWRDGTSADAADLVRLQAQA